MIGNVIGVDAPQSPTFIMAQDPLRDNTSALKSCDILAEINRHDMDHRLRFEAEGHSYFFDDKKIDTSATRQHRLIVKSMVSCLCRRCAC